MRPSPAAWLAIGLGSICATVLVFGLGLGWWSIPLYRLPKPSGPADVGTRLVVLRDAGGPSITTQVWYPSAVSYGKHAPYLLDPKRSLQARLIASLIGTNALRDAPVQGGPHPVLVAIPGWGGTRENNSALAESLASSGYVVVGIDDMARPEIGMNFDSEDAAKQSVAWANRKLQIQSALVTRVLSSVVKLNTESGGPFEGRLNAAEIGLVGFSFGGAVAAETSLHDARVRASINMDGSMYGTSLAEGVAKPFLFMMSGPTSSPEAGETQSIFDRYDRENGTLILRNLKKTGGDLLSVDGFEHYNFVDAALLPSIRHTDVGPIDPRLGHELVVFYATRFLDEHVRGQPPSGAPATAFEPLATFMSGHVPK